MNPLMLTAVLSGASLVAYVGFRAFTGAELDSAHDAATRQAETRDLAEQIPDVLLDDLDGAEHSLASWSGKPLLINFWATWCAPCLREIPLLKEFQQQNRSLTVLGVAIDRPGPVAEFAEEMQFNYPVLVGQASGMNAAAAFGVDVFALPFSVFVDASGATLGVRTGELHEEHLANFANVIEQRLAPNFSLTAARRQMSGHR